jgi:tRNA pseudouridine55 synthase
MQDSIILINKPKGITSYDVIRQLQKKLNIKRIGHAGVLDKPASGLLVCATNRATKVLSLFENGYKIYLADILLGVQTDTYDLDGKIINKVDDFDVDIDAIYKVAEKFVGDITQTAPPFSNIKVKGKRLYKYAMKNEEIELPKRNVTVYGIEVLDYKDKVLKVMVKCSKGTYIRSLANDIGMELGVFGSIQSLRRVFSYPFSIESAKDVDNIEPLSINEALNFLPSLRIKDEFVTKIKNGVVFSRIYDCSHLKNGLYRVLDKKDNLLSIIEIKKNSVFYKFIAIN